MNRYAFASASVRLRPGTAGRWFNPYLRPSDGLRIGATKFSFADNVTFGGFEKVKLDRTDASICDKAREHGLSLMPINRSPRTPKSSIKKSAPKKKNRRIPSRRASEAAVG